MNFYSSSDRVYTKDFQKIINSLNMIGVIQGLRVTGNGSFDLSVSRGRALFTDAIVEAGGTTITVSAPDPVYDRKDLVYLSSSGSLGISTGIAAPIPRPPNIGGSNRIMLAEVYVVAGTTGITDSHITDERIIVYGNKYKNVYEGSIRDLGACRVYEEVEEGLVPVKPPFIGDTSIVGKWLFYEGTGDILHDFSPYKNHGRIYGARWVNGSWGWALSFDGVDDYVQTPYFDIFNQKSFTVMGWILCRVNKVDEAFFTCGDAFQTDRFLHLVVRYGAPHLGFYADDLGSPTTLPLNKWAHLAFVWEGPETKKQIIYVNGVYSCSRISTGLLTVTSGAGTIGGYAIYYHDGLIDDVRIYSRALSANEISYYYNATKAKYGGG